MRTYTEKEVREDIAEIYNNLIDDLTMAKNHEDGYVSYEEVIAAIKKYTLKVVRKKFKKYGGKEYKSE